MSKENKSSLGQRDSVSAKLSNAVRRDYMASPQRIMNQRDAFDAGKKTVVTIANPNREETHKKFVRVDGKTFFKAKELPSKEGKKNLVSAYD